MIKCKKEINFGMPALEGRRLTVYDIVTKLYYESTIKEAIGDYEISINDARDAVEYCKSLKCREDKDLIQFCDGCILRTIADGWRFDRSNFIQTKADGQYITVSKDQDVIFLGTLDELEDSEFGKVTWIIAEEIASKIT